MNNILDLDQGQYANRSQWPCLRRPDRTTSVSTMGSTAVEWKRRIDVMSLTENPHDLDQIQEIERTIAQLLKHGEPAEVDKGIIENGYSLLNATARRSCRHGSREMCGNSWRAERQILNRRRVFNSGRNGSIRTCPTDVPGSDYIPGKSCLARIPCSVPLNVYSTA